MSTTPGFNATTATSTAVAPTTPVANNPCIGCGVCCTEYRVSFHWTESTADPDGWVPIELTEPLRLHELAMRGTSSSHPRCIALAGQIGRDAHCAIHGRHPSCCRAVEIGSSQCVRARARHGFPPLAYPRSDPRREVTPCAMPETAGA